MQGLMVDSQLLLHSLLWRTERLFAEKEIITRLGPRRGRAARAPAQRGLTQVPDPRHLPVRSGGPKTSVGKYDKKAIRTSPPTTGWSTHAQRSACPAPDPTVPPISTRRTMSDSDKIKVTILPTGTMHADLTWLLINPANMASRTQPVKQKDWVAVPTHVVYIEHPNGQKLLWDSGVPRDWETRWAPSGLGEFFPVDAATEDMWLDSRLKQLNLEPGDIDYLLLSHLHLDHAANAQMWANTGTKIIVDEEEKKGAFSFDGHNLGAHIKSDYDGLTLDTINSDTEILPGITLLRTPGHTWGTMSLQVDLADSGTFVFASDSLYLKESYGPPAIAAGIVYDTVAWFRSVEKIRAIEERTNATIVFGHSAGQIEELKTGPGNYYT